MQLPEENTNEPAYAPKDSLTSDKSTLLSGLPSLLAFGSQPFIQKTLFKRETFDLPHRILWNKNINSVSESASGSKCARRDTRAADATALGCCNPAARRKCVQWKIPERDFTEDSSLSAISKKDSHSTCFNSADIAYKPHKQASAFQRWDERLSSSTFHELLESSWMSANLHCSMLHLNTEHAVSFVERQTPNLSVSTSALSTLAIPTVAESERHGYVPQGIKRQQRNEQFPCCDKPYGCCQVSGRSKSPKHKAVGNEEFVRDTRPDGNTLAFDRPTEISNYEWVELRDRMNQMHLPVTYKEGIENHMQTTQRRTCKHEHATVDGQYHTSHQRLSPFVAATETQISTQVVVAPENSVDFDEKKIAERCEDLYRFRLWLRCLRMWSERLRLLSLARCHDRRRILRKALYILRWAVKMHCAQTEAVVRRKTTFLLFQSFYQWKNRYESRQSHNKSNTDALRKRLIQPSRTLDVMTTCSAWWNLDVLRTAVIHSHLSVLYKHWLLWKQSCLERFSRRQQEWWSCVRWDRRLKSKAWTLWILTWQRKQMAIHQYRIHLVASAWTKWKISNSQKKLKKLMQSTQMIGLLHYFNHWQRRAESRQTEREKLLVLSRRILHSWYCYVQKTKLTRLSARASWELSRYMLAATFRKWRDVTRKMQDTRRCLERLCHLQDKAAMQTAFTKWRQNTQARKELMKVRENLQRAQLSRCLSAWRKLVQLSASLQHYCHHRKALTLKTCLQRWRRSLQLHSLLKEHLIHQLQRKTGKRLIVGGMMHTCKTYISAKELSSTLLLQNTLHKWSEILQKQQLAQSAQERVVQRAVLLEWHRHTQAVFSDGVLLFTARWARLHPSSSASLCSVPLMSTTVPQIVLLRALGRMMHSDLSLAFSQWRSLVLANRDMRLQADLCRNSRRREELTVALWVWRAHTQMHRKAVRHWERGVLFHAVVHWKELFWQRCRTRVLEQQAMITHDANLLRQCFLTWTRLAVGPHCEQLKCAVKQMERRTQRHRLNLSFSTWKTCVSQQQTARAVYLHTLQNRVFLAWQRCFQVCKQRQASALFHSQYTLMHACFSQWRIICAQQQLATGKIQHTLHLRAKVFLQQWRNHAHCRAHRQAVLCEYNERRKKVMKTRTFLIWTQTVEYFRGAQHYHQRALKFRYFSQWLHEFRHQSALLCLSIELDEIRTQRLQWRAFCLWKLKLSHVHAHMHHITSRFEDTRLLCLFLCVWRKRLVERKRARLAVHQWKQYVSRARKQRKIMWKMKNMFLCWKAAFRQRVMSRDHHTQRQHRRVLLAWYRQTVSAQSLRYREAWFQYSSEMRLLAAVFMQWRGALIQSQQSRVSDRALHRWRTAATEHRAIKTFNNRLLRKWFKRWTQRKDLLKASDMFCVNKRRNKAQFALRTWSLWAKEHKAQRQMGEAVSLWLEGRGVSRTFHHWVKVYQQYQRASRHRQTQLSHRAVEKGGVQGLTHLYWNGWKNQTEASLLCAQQYEHSVLQRAWLTWRKRCIRKRVSADHSANFNNTLLAKVLRVWWQRAHESDFEP